MTSSAPTSASRASDVPGYAPLPDGPPEPRIGRRARFLRMDNMFRVSDDSDVDLVDELISRSRHRGRQATIVDELIVWGGDVANCGEDNLSRIVHQNRGELRSVVYCPDRTKGGALIRPCYFEGDRSSKCHFPKLEYLAIRVSPPLSPYGYGWITPELRHLRLLHVAETSGGCQGLAAHSLKRWLNTDSPDNLACAMLAACPKLEVISIVLCSTAKDENSQIEWMEMRPPSPVPWDIHKLLLLPLLKPVTPGAAAEADTTDGRAQDSACQASPLSSLPEHILRLIFRFIGSPRWQYTDHVVLAPENVGIQPEMLQNCSCQTILDGSWR